MDERPASEDVFRGRRVTVRVETLPEPNGGTTRFEIVQTADAVAVVAVRRGSSGSGAHEVLLVRQLRPAVGRELWEIPAGIMDHPGEDDPAVTAARELAEETGYAADEWRLLTRELPSPGFSTEAISIFLATGVHPAAGALAGTPSDPTEIERVRWVSLAGALRDVQSGALDDGKTVLGLTLAAAALGELGNEGQGQQGGQTTMPLDPTNIPFQRRRGEEEVILDRSEQLEEETIGEGGGIRRDSALKLDNMLLEEFNYANVTAYQAMEDRARMFNLFLILIGVVASAVFAIYQVGNQIGDDQTSLTILVVVLLLIGAFLSGVFFVMQIQVRRAWRQSAIAMSTIKEYYIHHFKVTLPDVERAFAWRLSTIPASERRGSTTYMVCYTVAFLGAVCLGAAVGVGYATWLLRAVSAQVPLSLEAQPWVLGIIVALVYVLFFTRYFRRALNPKKERKQITKAEKAAGV
ncbi:MAG TPA: NUDIX hydrolase [Ktedonobacterales bacterium]